MLHALRAELDYCRPWLFGGLGIAAGVVVLISVVFLAVGDDGPQRLVAAGLRGMFMIMAPMIVGFIVQAYRSEERRSRLFLGGPLTPRELAVVNVLLPNILFVIGLVAAGLVVGIEALITGNFAVKSLSIASFAGGQLFAYVHIGLLIQETVAARDQNRRTAALTGWSALIVGILLLVGLYVALSLQLLTWFHLIFGHLFVASIAMATSIELYSRRTDFTR